MAQTRKKAEPTPKESKKSEDRVVKRPARGFHKFRNEILNVTPKGGEKELVESNQNSPLLRLLLELRGRIWELVIGEHVYRPIRSPEGRFKYQLKLPTLERGHTLALLRTCRQIYAETALLPFKLSIVIVPRWSSLKRTLNSLKSFQYAQIQHIQMEMSMLPLQIGSVFSEYDYHQLNLLTGVKRIRVLVFNTKHHPENEVQAWMAAGRGGLERILPGKEISVDFEVSDQSIEEHVEEWD